MFLVESRKSSELGPAELHRSPVSFNSERWHNSVEVSFFTSRPVTEIYTSYHSRNYDNPLSFPRKNCLSDSMKYNNNNSLRKCNMHVRYSVNMTTVACISTVKSFQFFQFYIRQQKTAVNIHRHNMLHYPTDTSTELFCWCMKRWTVQISILNYLLYSATVSSLCAYEHYKCIIYSQHRTTWTWPHFRTAFLGIHYQLQLTNSLHFSCMNTNNVYQLSRGASNDNWKNTKNSHNKTTKTTKIAITWLRPFITTTTRDSPWTRIFSG